VSAEPVTVVIVTYNSADVIGGCLDSLPAALAGIDHEVVVVDNASSDATAGIVDASPVPVKVVQTGRNAGYAAAINAGVGAARPRGDLLVLNPDVRLTPGSVAALQHALRTSHAGVAVPRLESVSGELQFSLRRDPSVLRTLGEALLGGGRAGRRSALGERITVSSRYDVPVWADWAAGAVMLISRECRSAVGPWDEEYFLYCEETDFCQRARQARFGIRYVPDAHVVHIGGDLEQSAFLRRLLIRSKVRLYGRSHSPLARTLFRAALIVNEALRAAAGSRRHRAGLSAALRPGAVRLPADARPPAGADSADRADQGFLFFSAQDYWYHNRAHSDIQLARGLARQRTVLLVNSIGMRVPVPGKSTQALRRVGRKLRSIAHAVRRPEPELPNLYVMSPVILPFYGNAWLRRVNAASIRWQVRAVARRLGLSVPHVIVTIPTAWDVVRDIPMSSLIVNRSDKYSSYGETNSETMAQLEGALLARAEAAVYVNHELMDDERPLLERGQAHFLGHGVDFDRFAGATPADVPADLRAIRRPVIGFFGGIDDYVIDFELLERIAVDLPDASLVLIGAATCDMSPLTRHENVHWLGPRPYDRIPAYGAGFDVAIMPWLQNEWIRNCNPIKAKEYLALGKPIVTTRYPEAVHLDDVMAIADGTEDFIRLVREALAGRGVATAAARRERVRGDSWEGRAEVLLELADRAGAR
jgi:GT2 family glycosyltransferase/glycosyltransferase involved in cell wall biosynthesis